MKFQNKARRKPSINITSLIDVQFIMLIFFMVTSTFLEQPGMKLELPKAKSAVVESVENLVVYIDREKRVYVNDKLVALDRLSNQLQELITKDQSPTLVLRADKEVPHGLVVSVMDIAKQIGIKRLVVATQVE